MYASAHTCSQSLHVMPFKPHHQVYMTVPPLTTHPLLPLSLPHTHAHTVPHSLLHNHHGSELEEESSQFISSHHGGFSSGSGGSGLFKSNGTRVNGNGMTTLQGPSAGNYLAPSSSAPARKKYGMSASPNAVAKRR